ncbi:hypothetical protein DM860_008311 [Cuscuta australis]|uniref:RING-type domain-containing protein n=1 Tax=Cuscuta australis TaxID=267555 RepID=A0A328D774_9ASTE|nr:hypothetical protein DM860_008311 [Cuscuta australis]
MGGNGEEIHTQKETMGSEYEHFREERIKENLERMRKLGIFDLSLRFKSIKPNICSKSRKTPQIPSSPLPSPLPARRSSRLQNATPVSYSEIPLGKRGKSLDIEDDLLAGSKAEVYTEEHEKLLGSTEMSWTLFVDGCGKDGKRIYDPVTGKTCHQCRQKTLGLRTHCSHCNMIQGQFCGDCLFMRYGEHVLEANQNPDWRCPVCRGICNCSLCRQAKGWAPTGALYRKINRLGYKSVAHYLIQTRREKTGPDNHVPDDGVPAKRSLPFSVAETQAETNENMDKESNTLMNITPMSSSSSQKEECIIDDSGEAPQPCDRNHGPETSPNSNEKPSSDGAQMIQETSSQASEAKVSDDITDSEKMNVCPVEPIPGTIDATEDNDNFPSDGTLNAQQNWSNACDVKPADTILGQNTSPPRRRKRPAPESIPDSIGRRLRERRARTR